MKEPITHTFVLEEKTIWLLQKAVAELCRAGHCTKADKRRLVFLAETVLLRAYISPDPRVLGFDHRKGKVIELDKVQTALVEHDTV